MSSGMHIYLSIIMALLVLMMWELLEWFHLSIIHFSLSSYAFDLSFKAAANQYNIIYSVNYFPFSLNI